MKITSNKKLDTLSKKVSNTSAKDNAKVIKNVKSSNNKSTNSSKKVTTVKNNNGNSVKNFVNQTNKPSSSKKVSIKYNLDSFKKEVSKVFFNKLKSKYNGEYLLAEEYSQFALSIKVFHTKCGHEFYTNSSTLLSKRPACPFCEYSEYIDSKK